MRYNFIRPTRALITITVLSTSILAMEKIPAVVEPLSPHKQEMIQIKCDLMTAIKAGIHGKDSPKKFSAADLDKESQEATPRKFKKMARTRFQKVLQERLSAQGITPDIMESFRESVLDDINIEAMADEGHSPAASPFKAQIVKVASRLEHPGLDVRQTYSGNLAYTRGGMLVIDESAVEKVAPTTPLKEALWAHELTHDKEQDLVTRLSYERAFEHKGEPMTPTSKESLERFHEIFADIQEASTPKSAQATHQLAQSNAQHSHQSEAYSHPKSEHRVKITELNHKLVNSQVRASVKRRLEDSFNQKENI